VSLHAGASTGKVSSWRAALYSPLRSARGRRGQGHSAESRSPVGLAKPQGLALTLPIEDGVERAAWTGAG
jgi:hypothetical protein